MQIPHNPSSKIHAMINPQFFHNLLQLLQSNKFFSLKIITLFCVC